MDTGSDGGDFFYYSGGSSGGTLGWGGILFLLILVGLLVWGSYALESEDQKKLAAEYNAIAKGEGWATIDWNDPHVRKADVEHAIFEYKRTHAYHSLPDKVMNELPVPSSVYFNGTTYKPNNP